jgi:hypothetical protein
MLYYNANERATVSQLSNGLTGTARPCTAIEMYRYVIVMLRVVLTGTVPQKARILFTSQNYGLNTRQFAFKGEDHCPFRVGLNGQGRHH